jgi:tetratricopeptide (TPR) repeat protein
MSLETKVREAIRLHQLGKVSVAKKRYQQILQVDPNNFDALHMLGVAVFGEGNGSLAVEYIQRAILIFGKSPIVYFNLGNAYFLLLKMSEAEVAYQKAISLDKHYVDAYLNLAATFSNLGKYAVAIDTLNLALRLRANCPKINYQLGQAYALNNQVQNAERCLKCAIHSQPNFPEPNLQLGNLFANQRRFDEAIFYLTQTLRIQPRNCDALQSLGGVLAETGKFDEAESSFKAALEINPNAESIKVNQASLFRLKGEAKTALQICQQVLEKSPTNNIALNLAAQVSMEQGDLRTAHTYYLKNYISNDAHKWKQESGAFSAVCSYLLGHRSETKELLTKLQSSLVAGDNTQFTVAVAVAYHGFLNQLITNHLPIPSNLDDELFVIAESHGLSYHDNTVEYNRKKYKCKSLWILGCKQWHLASPSPNNYKVAVETQLGKIPKGSAVLVVFGEIDCRLTSGIIPFQKKNPQLTLEQVVKQTVIGYLDFISTRNTIWNHNLIFSGIPAPNIDTGSVSQDELQLLIRVIRMVNDRMNEECKNRQFDFLDVHAMTNRGDGISCGFHHIDAHHLTPAACKLAFKNLEAQSL